MAGLFMVKQTIDIGEFGNPLLNIYGYLSFLEVIGERNALLDAFEAQMLPKWANCVHESGSTIQLECLELNTVNYTLRVLGTPVTGVTTGQVMPPFVALSFKLLRAALFKRSGGKRIGPIAEATVEGRALNPDSVADVEAFADAYGAPLKVGLIDTWFPVILERPLTEESLWNYHDSAGALFDAVSTQNTRKK